jgi:hypothetical protein
LGLGTVWAVTGRLEDTFYIPLDYPAFRYYQEPADPVSRLDKQLENGQAKVDFVPNQAFLTTLLRQLDIDIESRCRVLQKQYPNFSYPFAHTAGCSFQRLCGCWELSARSTAEYHSIQSRCSRRAEVDGA